MGKRELSRRNFLQTSAAALTTLRAPHVHAAFSENFQVNIGLIGCGGRGTGALLDAVGAGATIIYPESASHTEEAEEGTAVKYKDIQVVALADLFENRLEDCHRNLKKIGRSIPKEHQFLGFDAHKQLLAIPEINYIILATPPHFRPIHLKAAIEAGKNVFMEKPAAVDIPGIKSVMESGRLAKQKGLGIVAGTQRRHSPNYVETIKRIHDGAI